MSGRTVEELLTRAAEAKRESRYLDFKERLDPKSEPEWIELIKDIVAMANSGGGVIVFGVRNNGTNTGEDVGHILYYDPAKITDKLFRYTGEQFEDFEMHEVKRSRETVAALVVEGREIPLPFSQTGRYDRDPKKPKTVFAAGSIYFRHGAKSEPARSEDLEHVIERRLEAIRSSWLDGIRKVVSAEPGAPVGLYEETEVDEAGRPVRIRLTNEPGAPVFRQLDADETHPYRQKEAIEEINQRLDDRMINSHDFLAVRRTHDIDEQTEPTFCHKPRWGSPQYSDAFVDWFVDHIEGDPGFLDDARRRYYEMSRRR